MAPITKFVTTQHPLQSMLLHNLYKAHCYTTPITKSHCNTTCFTKPVATQHPLQNLLVHNPLQSPKETPSNIYRSLCLHLAIFYKIPKYYQKPQILFWQHFTKKRNTTLATFHQKPKTINFWANNYSIKAQILFGKNIILCSKPKVNNLWHNIF